MSDSKDEKFRVHLDDNEETLIIEWDDDHPDAALFAEWSEEDWILAIKNGSKVYNENQKDG